MNFRFSTTDERHLLSHQALFHVSDIKQYFYCPRIIYFTYCLPVGKKTTYKMEHGKERHLALEDLEKRRTLARYGLRITKDVGERFFRLPLSSGHLGLSGILDLLIKSGEDYIPVEFKNTKARVLKNHRYQLAAYACLVEDLFKTRVKRGFLYFIPKNEVTAVKLNDKIKQEVLAALSEIKEIAVSSKIPEAPAGKGKCIDCEFLRYCGDRY